MADFGLPRLEWEIVNQSDDRENKRDLSGGRSVVSNPCLLIFSLLIRNSFFDTVVLDIGSDDELEEMMVDVTKTEPGTKATKMINVSLRKTKVRGS